MIDVVEEIMVIVRNKQFYESSGHDWWHTLRVYNNSVDIAKHEQNSNINILIVQLGSLLHDIADYKFGYTDNDRDKIIREILDSKNLDEKIIEEVIYIVNNISFKKGNNNEELKTIEAKIVQDADRLDAIGAIGIARTFTYGGFSNRNIYNPELEHENIKNIADNDNKKDTLQHFYEKLLLLKNKMNTEYGKKKAVARHEFMEAYLQQFYLEFEGKL